MVTDCQKREVFHFLFLEWLLRVSDPKIYVLKGGVNLRFFFQSPRFSEDMDIDVLAGAVHTLKKNGYKILKDLSFQRSLRVFGIDQVLINDPSKAKQTQTVQRFRVQLLTSGGDFLPTRIEFSRRTDKTFAYCIDRVNPEISRLYQRLAFPCQHYTGESAVLQKILALAGREQTQARDVFDLQVLSDAGYFQGAELKKHIEKGLIKKAIRQLQALQYQDFEGHVLEFLDEPDRKRYQGKDRWEAMKSNLSEMIQNG